MGLAFTRKGTGPTAWNSFTGRGRSRETPPSPLRDGLACTAANVVNLINNERTRSGLTPLRTGDALTSAALTRAREMNVKFDIVTRPDGRTFDTVPEGQRPGLCRGIDIGG